MQKFFGHLHVILSDNKAYITFPAYELEDCPSFMSALKYEICTLEISKQRNLCSSQNERNVCQYGCSYIFYP